MSETYLDRAITNYNAACTVFNSCGQDEVYLNIVGYHLQQAVELAVKFTLEQNGADYYKTRDIDQLIRIAKKNGVELYTGGYIEDHAEMFSLWEARTRYVLDYRPESQKVVEAFHGVCEYLNKLKEVFAEKEEMEEENICEKETDEPSRDDDPDL